MPRLIIAIQKKVNLHGHNVRNFRYDAKHALHIWEGREFELEEFNKISKKVFHENAGLFPFALVVGAGEDGKAAEAVQVVAVVTPKQEDEAVAHAKARIAELEAEVAKLHAALVPPVPVVPAATPAKSDKKQKGAGS
jgi:hypothetical protein